MYADSQLQASTRMAALQSSAAPIEVAPARPRGGASISFDAAATSADGKVWVVHTHAGENRHQLELVRSATRRVEHSKPYDARTRSCSIVRSNLNAAQL